MAIHASVYTVPARIKDLLTKDSSEIGDGGKSDCNQHAKEMSELGRLLCWIVNPGAFMDKKVQLELERV